MSNPHHREFSRRSSRLGSAILLASALASGPATAATFAVTSVADTGGTCTVKCTLRQAIASANASADASVSIVFAFDAGVQVIEPATALPAITHANVTVDGYSQDGSSPNTLADGNDANILVRIDGGGAEYSGIELDAAGAIVRGLSITGFRSGIRVGGAGQQAPGAVIAGNYLGVAPDLVAAGNRSGILVNASADVLVGGTTPAAANLIAGNGNGNAFEGGIGVINIGVDGTRILGNRIGLTAHGQTIGNAGSGIVVYQFAGNVDIGDGTTPGANRITGSDQGIFVDAGSAGVRLRGNEIFANGAMAIDLGSGAHQPDGVTPNDGDDADDGANALQNFPVLTGATLEYGSVRLTGALDVPHTALLSFHSYAIDVYANAQACDVPERRQGELFLGSDGAVLADSNIVSIEAFTAFVPAAPIGARIAATATDIDGNTSEFSACVTLSAGDGIFRNDFEN